MTHTVRTARRAAALALFPALASAQGLLYWGGGSADIVGPLLPPTVEANLAGTWNTTTQNWTSSPAGTTYEAWTNGSRAILGYTLNPAASSIPITVAEDLSLSGLQATHGGSGFNQLFNLTRVGGFSTVTLTGAEAVFTIQTSEGTKGVQFSANNVASGADGVRLAGSADLVKFGQGLLSIQTPSQAFTGDITVRHGRIQIGGGSAANDANLRGVTAFNLVTSQGNLNSYQTPTFTISSRTTGAQNAIADNAVFTLSRGILEYRGRQNATPANVNTETIGSVVLAPHGILDLDTADATAANRSVLTLADGLVRDTTHATMLMQVNGTTLAPIADVVISGWTGGSALLPWATTNRGDFLRVNASNILEVVPQTAAPTNLATWVAGSDYIVGDNALFASTNAIPTIAINSLGIFAHGTTSLPIGAGNTLTLSSGGLAFDITGTPGTTTISGGSLTSGTNVLYANTGQSGNNNTLIIQSDITGAIDFVKAGNPTLTLSGTVSNTFTGTTYVNNGVLQLSKTGGAIAIPGDVVIENGGSLASGSNQIATTSDVTVRTGGTLNQNGGQTYGGVVTLDGGQLLTNNQTVTFNAPGQGLVVDGGYIVHSSTSEGVFNIQTGVLVADAPRTVVVERHATGNFSWNLGVDADPDRVITVEDSSTLAAGAPELLFGARFTGTNTLVKEGAGTLELVGTNTHTGGTVLNAGTLRLGTIDVAAGSAIAYTNAGGSGANQFVALDRPIPGLRAGQAVSIVGAGASGGTLNTTVTNVISDTLIGIGSAASTVGAFTANFGAVSQTGSLASGVTVNGGRLEGVGNIGGAITLNGGEIAPGLSIGTLPAVSLAWNGGTMDFELGASNTADLISLSGAFDKGTGPAFLFDFNGGGENGSSYTLLTFGSTTFIASDFAYVNLAPTLLGSFRIEGGTSLMFDVIPEPSTWALLGGALALGLAVARRRRS